MYVFVRTDLPHPQQVVQACHAIQEADRVFPIPAQTPNVIILSVEDEAQLRSVIQELTAHNIGHAPFREPDMGNQITAVATEPVHGSRRRLFRKHRLLVANTHAQKETNHV